MVNVNMSESDYSNRKFFSEGVHKVKITGAVLDALDDGREYIEIGVEGDDGADDVARMWLTTDKSTKFALRTLQSIAVHNVKGDEQKEKIRQFFVGAIDDTKIRKALDKFTGYEAWFSVYQSNRTYKNESGETKHSYDRNIYGYEPMPEKPTVEDIMGKTEPVDNTDDVPFFS